MWDRLSEPWRVCLTNSWDSYCEGSVPIGAVIVDQDGKILSKGRNRWMASAKTNEKEIIGGQLAHAELNAILALDQSGVHMHTLELFTTVEPCPLCIGAICMAGIKTFRYAARDNWAGSANLLKASPYLQWKRIKAISPQDCELETVIHMFQVVEQLRSGHSRTEEVLEKWSLAYPENVHKGRLLFESRTLEKLCSEGVSAEQVVTTLYEKARVISS
jgi:tRNA(adenine34) deaminase